MQALVKAPIGALQDGRNANEKAARDKTRGFEAGYRLFGINGKILRHGEPVGVKQGTRMLLQALSAPRERNRQPGHRFRIVALGGNAVPRWAAAPLYGRRCQTGEGG